MSDKNPYTLLKTLSGFGVYCDNMGNIFVRDRSSTIKRPVTKFEHVLLMDYETIKNDVTKIRQTRRVK